MPTKYNLEEFKQSWGYQSAYVAQDGIGIGMISHYDQQLVKKIFNKIFDEYRKEFQGRAKPPGGVWKRLDQMLEEFQTPEKVDVLVKVQRELDDTIAVVVSNQVCGLCVSV